MGVVRLSVNPHVYCDLEGVRQPPSEPLGQGRLLFTREATWQGRVNLPAHDGVPTPIVGFHAIPEIFAPARCKAMGQEYGKRCHMPLLAKISDKASPRIHHSRGGPIGADSHRRPAL